MAAGNAPQAAQVSSQVKSATRTLDIIEYAVSQDRPLVAQEIATALAIPVSSLSYLLSTLVERRYLQRDGRRYSPGPGLERLQARKGGFTLAERAAPLVRTLRVQLDETASFFVRKECELEAIVTESSAQALRYTVATGTRLPMHALSSGKAMLASLDEAELDRYFAQSAPRKRFTAATVTAEKPLRKELDRIRESGFATTDGEYSLGIRGIGRAVSIDGDSIGALSVAIPSARWTDALEARAMKLLAQTASLMDAG